MSTLNLFGWQDGGMLDHLRRTKADRVDVHPSGEDDVGPRGLLVRDPYASQILNGEKVWEIRGRPTQIRGPVVIVKSGTGQVFGTANLVRVLGPLDLEDLVDVPELPASEREELRRCGLPYSKTYAYVFTNPRWFERPIPYKHPSGAVTWVRLPEIDLEIVGYAPSSVGAARTLLV
nr:ASCH domain-containing protein [uncultured Rhodopila sp.]